jgi:NitT/TauT family transport system substrate-binding protein
LLINTVSILLMLAAVVKARIDGVGNLQTPSGCVRLVHQASMPCRNPNRRSKMPRQRNFLTVTPWLAALACATLAFVSTPSASQTARQLRIGVQFGLGYLPLYVAEEKKLFEQHMRQQGTAPVPVEIVHVAGGPQINDGLLSGNFEMGSGGYTAMMVSWDKTRNAGDSRLLGVTALSSVPYDLFSTDSQLTSVKDLSPQRDKIGVPSVKVSVPAIYLQMEAERLFGVGKHTALDDLTVSLSQPDGAISLLSGGTTVNCYLFSPPFIQQVTGKAGIRRIWSSNELFGSPATALTTWTTVRFQRENPKLFVAFVSAIRDAIALIANDSQQAAAIYLKAEKTKAGPELIAAALADKDNLRFTLAPEHTERIADFLARTGSIRTKPASWKDLFFPDIHGEQGS